MGERVGASDDEGIEGQARVERRTAERLVHGRNRSPRGTQIGAIGLDLAQLARSRRHLDRLALRRQGADHGRAHRELDARETGLLGLPAGQHALGIMGLDPALEEARGDGQLDGISLAAVELHAREPARVDVVTDFGAKAILHPRPALLIHARHPCVSLAWSAQTEGVERGLKRDTSGRPLGPTRGDRTQERRRWEEWPQPRGRGVGRGSRRRIAEAGELSARGRCRPARSNHQISQQAVGAPPDRASRGCVDPPCCHETPLSIAAALGEGYARVQTLRSIFGLLRVVDAYNLNATKLRLKSTYATSGLNRS